MDYRTEALKPDGALKSNPFAGFESYTTAPAQNVVDTPAEEKAEGDREPRNIKGSVPTDSYRTA